MYNGITNNLKGKKMTEQITFNIDAAYDERADYVKDMAAVEAQERKRQRELDGPEEIGLEILAEWEARDAADQEEDSYLLDPDDDYQYPADEWDEE